MNKTFALIVACLILFNVRAQNYAKIKVSLSPVGATNFGYRVYCEGMESFIEKDAVGVKNNIFKLAFYTKPVFGPSLIEFINRNRNMYFQNLSDKPVRIIWRTKYESATGLNPGYDAKIKYYSDNILLENLNVKKDFLEPYKKSKELQIKSIMVPFDIKYDDNVKTYNLVFEFAYPYKLIE